VSCCDVGCEGCSSNQDGLVNIAVVCVSRYQQTLMLIKELRRDATACMPTPPESTCIVRPQYKQGMYKVTQSSRVAWGADGPADRALTMSSVCNGGQCLVVGVACVREG